MERGLRSFPAGQCPGPDVVSAYQDSGQTTNVIVFTADITSAPANGQMSVVLWQKSTVGAGAANQSTFGGPDGKAESYWQGGNIWVQSLTSGTVAARCAVFNSLGVQVSDWVYSALVTYAAPAAGGVTSVGITGPSILSWTGSPVTGSGTFTGALVAQAPNAILANHTALGVPTKDTSVKATGTASAPTINVSTSAANELIILAVGYASTTALSAPTASGLTFNLVQAQTWGTGTGRLEIWEAFATVQQTTKTITVTLPASVEYEILVDTFSGVPSTGTEGAGVGLGLTGGGSGSVTMAAVTTAAANDWVASYYHSATTTAPTAGANYVLTQAQIGAANQLSGEFAIAPTLAVGTVTPTYTATVKANGSSITFILPGSNATAVPTFAPATIADLSTGFPTDYISGCTLLYSSTTQIQVTKGSAYSTAAGTLVTVTGTISNSPTLAASTLYYVYLASSTAIEVTTTAPTLYQGTAWQGGTGSNRRYLGSFLTNGSSQIVRFNRVGNCVLYVTQTNTSPYRVLTNGNATTATSVGCGTTSPATSAVIPPTSTVGLLTLSNGATGVCWVGTSDQVPLNTAGGSSGIFVLNVSVVAYGPVPLNATQQFQYIFNAGSTGLTADIHGYYEDL